MAKRSPKRWRKAPAGTISGKAKRNDWQTPEHLLAGVRAVSPTGAIHLDPATAPDNPTRARKFCAPAPKSRWHLRAKNGGAWVARDGLGVDWVKEAAGGLVFCNPPYGAGGGGRDWLAKIAREAERGAVVVALLSVSRTEQPYLTGPLRAANSVCFVRGRVAFRNPDSGDLVGGGCYSSMFLGFNVPLWRFRMGLEPLAGTRRLVERGEQSACFELRPL